MKKVSLRIVSTIIMVFLCGGLYPSAKAIQNFTVEVTPKITGAVAEYKFQFTLEKKIEVHQSFHIIFPKGTTLTPPIPEGENEKKLRLTDIVDAITFNNDPCTACLGLPIITFESDGTLSIQFRTPMDLDPAKADYKATTITISAKAGITNPPLPGTYTYKIRNLQEPTYVESQPVSIPEVKIEYSGGKQGKNGWFIEPPMILFSCSEPDAKIFYCWNDPEGQGYRYNGIPIKPYPINSIPPVNPGGNPSAPDPDQVLSKLYFWTETKEGKTDKKEETIKIDLVNPKMIIESPKEEKGFTKKKTILIKGRTTAYKTVRFGKDILEYDKLVFIDENPAVVSDIDGSFSSELTLEHGNNLITIRVEDEAGRQLSRSYALTYGYVIQLTIGSMEALNNGEPRTLSQPPFIQKGYTLVPFRFIGEQLNATIDFTTNPDTKQVKTVSYELDGTEILLTIGSLKAVVNDNAILLSVPPQILKGSTFVPLRFVTEGLGCILEWDPQNLRITIQYPGKPLIGNTLVVVESFTATWLLKESIYAPVRDDIVKELELNRVAFINYYVDSTPDHPFPRLSCKESEDRMKWYMEDKGIVTMFFNGVNQVKGLPNAEDDSKEGRENSLKKLMLNKINKASLAVSPIKITGRCTHLENNTYKVTADLQKLGALNSSNYQLVIALAENNVPYNAINGEKIHNYVFREFLKPKEVKDTIGIPINLAVAGDNFSTEFTFELNTDLYKNDLNLIFFVQDMTSKNILQGLTIPVSRGRGN